MTASKWLMLLTQLTKNLVVSIFSFVSTVSFCRHDQNQDSGAAEPTDRIPVSGAEELRSEAGSILSGLVIFGGRNTDGKADASGRMGWGLVIDEI